MTYSCANAQSLAKGCSGNVGGGGVWAVGVHISKQTEIFMYVGPRRCVRAPSRVPLLALSIHASLHGYGIKNTAARGDILICTRTPVPACTCAALCQVMREALSLESAPKLRLCTSITHELLYMG